MRSIVSMTLAACAMAALEFAGACTSAGACDAAGAAVRGRHARCDAVRYSLWHVDRARAGQAGDGGGRSRSQEAKLEDEHRRGRYQRRTGPCSSGWKARRSPPARFRSARPAPRRASAANPALFYNAFETGHAYVGTLDPTLVASPGGFPLVEGGKLIGAVGCSGGTGDQDAAICKVGAEVVK